MPDTGLKFTLEKLGLKQGELAALLGVAPRTVSQWATGSQPLPGTVAGYLRLFEAARPSTRRRELDRLPSRSKKLDEGIYRIGYHGKANGEAETTIAESAVVTRASRWRGGAGSRRAAEDSAFPHAPTRASALSVETTERRMMAKGVGECDMNTASTNAANVFRTRDFPYRSD